MTCQHQLNRALVHEFHVISWHYILLFVMVGKFLLDQFQNLIETSAWMSNICLIDGSDFECDSEVHGPVRFQTVGTDHGSVPTVRFR